ncbi:hypothetical protein LBMAG42_24890 [Deltaproteobacteria bacterium]|nr:hypothetical protein LBMAG42_24890 [Deltaproteobacteria bacterium]
MTSSPLAFTLREDNARTSYAMKACADRLATSVSFDDEDTSDQPSVIVRFPMAGMASVPSRQPKAAPVAVNLPNPWADEEITNVQFGVP